MPPLTKKTAAERLPMTVKPPTTDKAAIEPPPNPVGAEVDVLVGVLVVVVVGVAVVLVGVDFEPSSDEFSDFDFVVEDDIVVVDNPLVVIECLSGVEVATGIQLVPEASQT